MDDWNVLATSVEGARPVLMAGLRRLGVFRGAGYRNVSIGRVEDVPTFLADWRDAMAGDTILAAAVGRVLPIVRTFRIDQTDPAASLLDAVEPLASDIDGRSFYVRIARRGLHGLIDSSEVERSLGTALWRLIEAAGWKGRWLGRARVSEAHANVIVTEPGATASDVQALIELVREAVMHRFGVRLETEVVELG